MPAGTGLAKDPLLRCDGSAPTDSLLNCFDDRLGYRAADAMRDLGQRLWNRKAQGKDLSIGGCLRVPHAEPYRLARPRGRRIQEKGGRDHLTSGSTERVRVEEALVHVPRC